MKKFRPLDWCGRCGSERVDTAACVEIFKANQGNKTAPLRRQPAPIYDSRESSEGLLRPHGTRGERENGGVQARPWQNLLFNIGTTETPGTFGTVLRPFDWMDEFPEVAESSLEYIEAVKKKWRELF